MTRIDCCVDLDQVRVRAAHIPGTGSWHLTFDESPGVRVYAVGKDVTPTNLRLLAAQLVDEANRIEEWVTR